jgi:hypothetical protein
LSGTLNYKSKISTYLLLKVIMTSNPGNAFTNSRYLNADNSTRDYVNETRETKETIKDIMELWN